MAGRCLGRSHSGLGRVGENQAVRRVSIANPTGGSWQSRLPALDKLANLPRSGGVVERSIAPVLKTGDPQGSVGSNPTPSAIRRSRLEAFPWDENAVRAGDRSPKATNPTPSAIRRSRLEAFPWDENAVRAGDRSPKATNPTPSATRRSGRGGRSCRPIPIHLGVRFPCRGAGGRPFC